MSAVLACRGTNIFGFIRRLGYVCLSNGGRGPWVEKYCIILRLNAVSVRICCLHWLLAIDLQTINLAIADRSRI